MKTTYVMTPTARGTLRAGLRDGLWLELVGDVLRVSRWARGELLAAAEGAPEAVSTLMRVVFESAPRGPE